MSNSVPKKTKTSVLPEQITIIVLLVAVVTIGLITVYKYMVKEPALTPAAMDIKRFTSAVKANPSDQASRLLLAHAYQRDRNYEHAIAEYNEALKTNPDELAALYNLGLIAIELKKYDEAEKHLLKVLKLKDNHVLGAIALGEAYIAQQKYDEAVKILDKAIAVQNTLAKPRILKAQALEKKGSKKEAIKEYQTVLRFIPDHAEALAGLNRLK